VSEGAEEQHYAALLTAAARVLVVGLIFAGEWVRLAEPPLSLAFDLTLAAAGIYALGSLAAALLKWPLLAPWWLVATLDLAFLGALTYTTAGDLATVRRAFFLVPVLGAFTQTPRATARLALAAPTVYSVAALAEGSGAETVWPTAAFLLVVGGVSVAIAKLLADRAGRIQRLAEESRALTARALEAEAGERRRLSYAIHDEPIQQLLAARFELGRAARGDNESALSAAKSVSGALRTLRELTFELHPHSLDQLGLAATLEELAERIADHSGAEIALEIDDRDVGARRVVCFAIVRELLRNAGEHASASRIDVSVRSEPEALRVVVSDDGRGIPHDRRAEALRDGHLGLAAVFERARAAGGRAEITSSPAGGTTVEVTLPARAF
jgi:two-component system, NarL family, sensor kinase